MSEEGGSDRSLPPIVREIVVVVLAVVVVGTTIYVTLSLFSSVTPPSFDFSLAISPESRSVAPGDSASATVTASLRSGLPRNVEYTCADLPSRTACTFHPPECGPPCSAGFVLGTSSNTPEGTYVVAIRGATGTLSKTVAFVLTVAGPPGPPSFDFTLSVDPSSGSTAPGGSLSTSVSATLASGTARAISFACSNLPVGTVCAFAPPSCSPTCIASLSLTTTEGTPSGNYSVLVTATDGSLSRSTSYSLTVTNITRSMTRTFQEGDGGGFSRTEDATIYSGSPDGNYGSDPLLLVDRGNCIANGTMCRSLLSFPDFVGPNEGQVPLNSTIESATLEFNVTNDGPSQRLYQVQEAWTEATVTWNSFAPPGTPKTKGPTVFYNATWGRLVVNITGIVQNWVNGDPNYGVFLQTDSWNGAQYRSSESVSPPKLTVTFRGRSVSFVQPPRSGGLSDACSQVSPSSTLPEVSSPATVSTTVPRRREILSISAVSTVPPDRGLAEGPKA